ncbi:MAG: hypothetical protein E3J58_00210 [Actinomycetota bacterium]|nr:MAG: hypothetical protein E3J58_00210 [Actinomycetota bacterium]
MSKKAKIFLDKALEQEKGLLHLAPAWVPRVFCIPGRRLKLHPDDLFALGASRGGIDERWFSSTCPADNGPGTPPDEGLSYVIAGGDRMLLKDLIGAEGTEILGDRVMSKWGGLKIFAKFFDNMEALPHHVHIGEEYAKLVNLEGKPEAYYFPPQVNFTGNNFPYTFFGLEPGTTKEDLKKCLAAFDRGDNKILDISKAYRLQLGTGWLIPPGILHAPGSLCSFEPQWASDVYMMFESLPSGKPIDKALLSKDVPDDKKDDLDFLIESLDWEKNIAPDFKKRFFLPAITIDNDIPERYMEKWVVYGRINGKEVFSAKELTVYSGAKVTIKDTGAYGLITMQGHGLINDMGIESPAMIRFGDITRDEFFVPYPAATTGVTIENTGHEPLVILKFFGPDCNADMPDKK